MKWSTLEALRILQDRLTSQGTTVRVLLMIPMGLVEGELADLTDTYEDSVAGDEVSEVSTVDVASATAHLRTELLRMYNERDPELQPTDTGALIRLTDVVLRDHGRRVRLPQLTLFATDVAGFAVADHAMV